MDTFSIIEIQCWSFVALWIMFSAEGYYQLYDKLNPIEPSSCPSDDCECESCDLINWAMSLKHYDGCECKHCTNRKIEEVQNEIQLLREQVTKNERNEE